MRVRVEQSLTSPPAQRDLRRSCSPSRSFLFFAASSSATCLNCDNKFFFSEELSVLYTCVSFSCLILNTFVISSEGVNAGEGEHYSYRIKYAYLQNLSYPARASHLTPNISRQLASHPHPSPRLVPLYLSYSSSSSPRARDHPAPQI